MWFASVLCIHVYSVAGFFADLDCLQIDCGSVFMKMTMKLLRYGKMRQVKKNVGYRAINLYIISILKSSILQLIHRSLIIQTFSQ